MDYNQIEQKITTALGIMSVQDKPALVRLLQKSGSFVNETNTQDQLLDAAFKAIKDSKRFRTDLTDYLSTQQMISNSDGGEASFSDDNYYSNFGTSRALVNRKGSRALVNKGTFADDSQFSNGDGTQVGNFLRSDAGKKLTTDTIGLGMNYLSTLLQNKAAKSGNQQAIDYQVAASQSAANQALANKTAADLAAIGNKPSASSTNKKSSWIMPVAIIGGVVVIGAIIFFVVKRKK